MPTKPAHITNTANEQQLSTRVEQEDPVVSRRTGRHGETAAAAAAAAAVAAVDCYCCCCFCWCYAAATAAVLRFLGTPFELAGHHIL